ncbi:MAG: hypothetical protein ACRDID_17985, partial [Ktedonobacterales bacterium]
STTRYGWRLPHLVSLRPAARPSGETDNNPMPTDDSGQPAHDAAPLTAEQRLHGLLADLELLQRYLDERGAHTYELAQRFMANAKRDPASRAYDERQATMLEYQHYIWREIAGRVGQLLSLYGADDAPAATAEDGQPS